MLGWVRVQVVTNYNLICIFSEFGHLLNCFRFYEEYDNTLLFLSTWLLNLGFSLVEFDSDKLEMIHNIK